MKTNLSEHIAGLVTAITDASRDGLLSETKGLTGFSGTKLMGTLQRIAAHQYRNSHGCYLEIGVYQGLSLVSVATAAKGMLTIGIDNFAFHDPDGTNLKLTEKRIKANDADNARIINLDYEDALEALENHLDGEKIGTYFIDGPHDYRSQLMCLHLAKPHLSNRAVILVDDSNYRHVRQANADFLKTEPEYKLLFEAYTQCHPINMEQSELEEARSGWWDGLNVLVRDEGNELPTKFPPTERNRQPYETEHTTQCFRYNFISAEATGIISNLLSFKISLFGKELVKLIRRLRSTGNTSKGIYAHTNTFSENIVGERIHIPTEVEEFEANQTKEAVS